MLKKRMKTSGSGQVLRSFTRAPAAEIALETAIPSDPSLSRLGAPLPLVSCALTATGWKIAKMQEDESCRFESCFTRLAPKIVVEGVKDQEHCLKQA
jgi:hypothetical protein